MTLRIDYTNMMGDVVDGGIAASDWTHARRRVSRARMPASCAGATPASSDSSICPTDEALHRQSTDFAAKARGKFDDIVVLGIGGSALGPIALRTALLKPQWNTLTNDERGGQPRLHVLDNVDPHTIAALLDRLALERTLFVVTSKSGGTAETMAQYLVVRDRLNQQARRRARPPRLRHRSEEGRAARDRERRRHSGASTFRPPSAAVQRADAGRRAAGGARRHRHGAAARRCAATSPTRCAATRWRRTSPACSRSLQFLADTKLGRHIQVLMPYSDPLRDMADWFVQLWAESLGKHRQPGDAGVGPTPLGALGATDQHSKVQLFMEGPPRQDRHVHRGRRGRRRRHDPEAAPGREGARLSRRPPARRAAVDRAAGDGRRAGAARPAEHDDPRRRGRRVARRRAVHAARDRDDLRRASCTA